MNTGFSTAVNLVARCLARALCAAIFAIVVPVASMQTACGYSPDDPVVRGMVDRGVAYLEKYQWGENYGQHPWTGAQILTAHAVYKATLNKDSRVVQVGLKQALALANAAPSLSKGQEGPIVYEAAVATVFLADYDPIVFRPQLNALCQFFVAVQKSHGGYGYLGRDTGDTSQTQYAVLALWTLHKNDVDVPLETREGVLRYLVRTQDPTGGWGYQAKLATSALVQQESVTKILGTAGLGATLISGDMLGIWGNTSILQAEDDDVPKAFVRIDLTKKLKDKSPTTIKKEDLNNTLNLGLRFQQGSVFQAGGANWNHYYFYSQERYESFLEIAQGKRDKSPAWYNATVELLRNNQDENGAWGLKMTDHSSPDICTSLAILTLIRSTQKTIAKLSEGVLAGGYGLPTDVGAIRRVGDQIVGNETTSVESLIGMLEKNQGDNVDVGLLPENLALSKDKEVRKAQVARLSRLISSTDYKARRIAAKLLGRSEDIDQVPELIYALTDPDAFVPGLAEESLRLLSRKLSVRHIAGVPTADQKAAAEKYWREWYLKMRPDYVFIDR
ncbi:MAG: hypothetical protein U0892_22860 [Pirellulales bacterium]